MMSTSIKYTFTILLLWHDDHRIKFCQYVNIHSKHVLSANTRVTIRASSLTARHCVIIHFVGNPCTAWIAILYLDSMDTLHRPDYNKKIPLNKTGLFCQKFFGSNDGYLNHCWNLGANEISFINKYKIAMFVTKILFSII